MKYVCREASRLSQSVCGYGADTALRACGQRAAGRLVARKRLPRHCSNVEGLKPYSEWSARGAVLFRQLCRGQTDEEVVAHLHLGGVPSFTTLLITTQHVYIACASGGRGWRPQWTARLQDILDVREDGSRLILNVRQDEATNYYSSDEKVIDIPDPDVLLWLRGKMECALVYALEDKRQE